MFFVKHTVMAPGDLGNMPIMFTQTVDTETEPGTVITWSGYWQNAQAIKLEKGFIINDWMIFQRESRARTDMTVTKVNRKTFRAVAHDDGVEYTFHVDR